MKNISKALAKGTMATVAAGAMAMATASPTMAQDRYRDYDRDRDGISAGEVIAGAVILGGLAAILGGSSRDRYDDRDYRYNQRGDNNNYNYNRAYDSRTAVDQCVRTAEQYAQRYAGADAEVYEIRDIERERYGYEVEGRIAVREYRGYDRGYGNTWGGGWSNYSRGSRNTGWDEGRFTCDWREGRVVGIDFSGIRGL